jgi:molybdenum cofactor cytidylyltransferase
VIAGLVLAAGTSSRMGAHKLLLPLDGRSLVTHAVEAAFAAGCLDEVVVVLGRDPQDVERSIAAHAGLRFVVNSGFRTGQASSLRTGLQAMAAEAEAAVVLLGDQPDVRPEAVRGVVDAFRQGATPVVQASYGGRPAHPTLLSRAVWPELEALTGDVGAREVIARRPRWRTTVEVGGDPPEDVDTDDDYRRLLTRYSIR